MFVCKIILQDAKLLNGSMHFEFAQKFCKFFGKV